jgi:hypothetical protein
VDDQADATNPRSIDQALSWQLLRLGSTAWERWSWKFQRLAYGFLGDDRWTGADQALAWFRAHSLLSPGPAPRGALVWYGRAGDPVVRCSLGDGSVIGPGLPDRVEVAPLDHPDGCLGWSDPIFPFAR